MVKPACTFGRIKNEFTATSAISTRSQRHITWRELSTDTYGEPHYTATPAIYMVPTNRKPVTYQLPLGCTTFDKCPPRNNRLTTNDRQTENDIHGTPPHSRKQNDDHWLFFHIHGRIRNLVVGKTFTLVQLATSVEFVMRKAQAPPKSSKVIKRRKEALFLNHHVLLYKVSIWSISYNQTNSSSHVEVRQWSLFTAMAMCEENATSKLRFGFRICTGNVTVAWTLFIVIGPALDSHLLTKKLCMLRLFPPVVLSPTD